ncbi:hypothetical protein EYB33_00415 (plasmid) [Lysinibacillus sphaericus]|uniref:hypothetical protein n=1 Tax=Lysinibacillus sphaericus TaxID=1421 RepID=UPI001E3DA96D|nr:hypothetical protein [Lysinibacillus sphaericus]UDK94852.1 hypothetical protein EYB33_00415 [Lysinibacillus sphaericus]
MKQVLKEARVQFCGWEDVLDSAKTDHAIITTIHAKDAMNIPSRLIPILAELEEKELIHLVPDEFLPKGGSKQS